MRSELHGEQRIVHLAVDNGYRLSELETISVRDYVRSLGTPERRFALGFIDRQVAVLRQGVQLRPQGDEVGSG